MWPCHTLVPADKRRDATTRAANPKPRVTQVKSSPTGTYGAMSGHPSLRDNREGQGGRSSGEGGLTLNQSRKETVALVRGGGSWAREAVLQGKGSDEKLRLWESRETC